MLIPCFTTTLHKALHVDDLPRVGTIDDDPLASQGNGTDQARFGEMALDRYDNFCHGLVCGATRHNRAQHNTTKQSQTFLVLPLTSACAACRNRCGYGPSSLSGMEMRRVRDRFPLSAFVAVDWILCIAWGNYEYLWVEEAKALGSSGRQGRMTMMSGKPHGLRLWFISWVAS